MAFVQIMSLYSMNCTLGLRLMEIAPFLSPLFFIAALEACLLLAAFLFDTQGCKPLELFFHLNLRRLPGMERRCNLVFLLFPAVSLLFPPFSHCTTSLGKTSAAFFASKGVLSC